MRGRFRLEPGSIVRFNYKDSNGEYEARRMIVESVEYGSFPFGPGGDLVDGWVVNGWCLDRQARRSFELARISGRSIRNDLRSES